MGEGKPLVRGSRGLRTSVLDYQRVLLVSFSDLCGISTSVDLITRFCGEQS